VRRKLFTLGSAVSLLLWAATAASWAWSYREFVDAGRITSTHGEEAYTQHLIRLGATGGRFLFTWRDIIWLRTNPSTAEVERRWDRETVGPFRKRQPTFDLNRAFPNQKNERTWRVAAAGCRFDRLIQDADASSPGMTGVVLVVPHAYVFAALAVLPAVYLVKLRRRRRRADRVGLCQSCGYDLRATPARCPECGAAGTMPASP
jgi:hypothetical protein